VRDEKLGSSKEHCRSIPAGRISSGIAWGVADTTAQRTIVNSENILSIDTSRPHEERLRKQKL
jgi:hypothetical protein